MNKTELIAAVAEKAELKKKDAEAAVAAVFESIAAELKKGEKVQLIGFGTFEAKKVAAHMATNPRTGEKKKVPAKKRPTFKAGKGLKDTVNSK